MIFMAFAASLLLSPSLAVPGCRGAETLLGASAAKKVLDARAYADILATLRKDTYYSVAQKREGAPSCSFSQTEDSYTFTFTFPKGAKYVAEVQPGTEIGRLELTISGLDEATAVAAVKKSAHDDHATYCIDTTSDGVRDNENGDRWDTAWWAPNGLNVHVAVRHQGKTVTGLYFGFAI